MRRGIGMFIACIIIVAPLMGQQIVITNVNVIPVEGGPTVMHEQTVFIDGDTIRAIIPYQHAHDSTEGTRINGTGKFLIPGLVDMHAHLPAAQSPTFSLPNYFSLCLASGVTTVRSMRGKPWHLALRDSIRRKQILAPDLFISTLLPYDSSVTASDLRTVIGKSKAEHWDFVKYLGGLTPALFDSAVQICKSYGIKLTGHVFRNDLQTVVDAGQSSIEHYSPLLKAWRTDSVQFQRMVTAMRERKITICPTLLFYAILGQQFSTAELQSLNGMQRMDPLVIADWNKSYAEDLNSLNDTANPGKRERLRTSATQDLADFRPVLKQLIANGVNVVLSPSPGEFIVPGFGMLEEMKLYRSAGISNYDILKCATMNAARFFDAQNQWGSIAQGKKANVVLLDRNPLEDIENVKGVSAVILGNRVLTPAELLKMKM